MVIGYDASRAFSENKTGVENYAYQLLIHLAKVDHKNTYLVFVKDLPDEKLPDNFHFVPIHLSRFWTQLGLGIKTFTTKMDLLFIPAYFMPFINNPGLKMVVAIHDLASEYFPEAYTLKHKVLSHNLQKLESQEATKIITISNSTKSDIVKFNHINPKKISVVYFGLDHKYFQPVQGDKLEKILSKFNLKKERYFLYVGTIQPRKNISRIIEGFANVLKQTKDQNLQLVLAGGKGWLSDEIYQLPQKLGIESSVKFLGRVDNNDLPALYSGALAFVFPSLYEGFGMPILEAMSCETPVITSKTSSLGEIAQEAALLVDPEKIDEIAHAMVLLIQDTKLRKNLMKKGVQRVNDFSWEKAARETLHIFEEVVSK